MLRQLYPRLDPPAVPSPVSPLLQDHCPNLRVNEASVQSGESHLQRPEDRCAPWPEGRADHLSFYRGFVDLVVLLTGGVCLSLWLLSHDLPTKSQHIAIVG